jgi:hypothetical protein
MAFAEIFEENQSKAFTTKNLLINERKNQATGQSLMDNELHKLL